MQFQLKMPMQEKITKFCNYLPAVQIRQDLSIISALELPGITAFAANVKLGQESSPTMKKLVQENADLTCRTVYGE